MAAPQTVSFFRLKQFVQMHDDIFHFGVVDRFLCCGAPSFFRGRIVRKHPDNVELFQISEFQCLRVFDPAPEHQMQFSFAQNFAPLVFLLSCLCSSYARGLYGLSSLADKIPELVAHGITI
jgi:hypothetical protein